MTLEDRNIIRARLDTAGSLKQTKALLDELHEIAKHDPHAGVYCVIGHANAIRQLDYGILDDPGPRPE